MELTPEILEACYRAGAFPMDDGYGRIGFYRADPRSILELDSLHVSRSLSRVLRRGTYEVRINRDFEAVIRACADRRDTWIGAEIIRAFVRFHEAGMAHSVEAYSDGELAGGLGQFVGEVVAGGEPGEAGGEVLERHPEGGHAAAVAAEQYLVPS